MHTISEARRHLRTAIGFIGMFTMVSLSHTAAGAEALAVAEVDKLPEVELGQDAEVLADRAMDARPVHLLDTALVFTNAGPAVARAHCTVYNANGRPVGRFWTRIPGNGVRVVFASNVSVSFRLVGSASCTASSAVIPSAFVIGNAFSDSPAISAPNFYNSQIRFPVVAAY